MNKIFISWSGNPKIAEVLKKSLQEAFGIENLSVFVSSENVITGEEWFAAIKNNLSESVITIVCVTKDNCFAPWLYFESGASSFHNFSGNAKHPLMVVLFDTTLPASSPLTSYNHVKWGKDGYIKLIQDIGKCLRNIKLSNTQIKSIAMGSYDGANRSISPIINEIKKRHSTNRITTYPEEIDSYDTDTLYLACPMASLDDAQYQKMRTLITNVRDAIGTYCKIKKKKIYAPVTQIDRRERFDGSEKAIADNFEKMKRAEYYVCLYPYNVASSVTTEIGYCIALKKNTIIFLKDGISLPYILSGSDKALPFVKIYGYNTVDDIINIFKKNQKKTLRTH